jgi:hypothetical protein
LCEAAALVQPTLKQITERCAVVAEAAENDLLDRSVAQGIVSLKGVHQSGAQGRELAYP